eukprot:5609956-Alexandrium_andersonii.AAC.1
MQHLIHRHILVWMGDVARMPVRRLPKQVMFGWVGGKLGKQAGVGILHPRFVRDVLRGAGVPVIDWFRQAQDRKRWRGMVRGVYPLPAVDKEHWKWLDVWRPGMDTRDAGVR